MAMRAPGCACGEVGTAVVSAPAGCRALSTRDRHRLGLNLKALTHATATRVLYGFCRSRRRSQWSSGIRSYCRILHEVLLSASRSSQVLTCSAMAHYSKRHVCLPSLHVSTARAYDVPTYARHIWRLRRISSSASAIRLPMRALKSVAPRAPLAAGALSCLSTS
jgi:hypothetical protein